MSSSSRILYAFLGGFVAGAVLGVLYAPDSGKNTREKLRKRLNELMQQLKGKLETTASAPDADGEPAQNGSSLSAQDYRRAEELLHEVESLLEDIKTGKA